MSGRPRCPACAGEASDPEAHVCGLQATAPAPARRPSHELETPPCGEVLAGRYVLLERVGEGGSGAVYRALDTELDVEVAVKVLLPGHEKGLLRRFKREIRITRGIDHPNVSRVFDIGESGTLRFLTMRWIDGKPLSRRVRTEGPLGARVLRRVATGLVSALAAAHRRGIVHRDVKPGNVLVSESGAPVLVDFGIAAAGLVTPLSGTEEDPSTPTQPTPTPTPTPDDQITVPGQIPGTPAYMAPEQARGEATTPATDLFALALTISYAATGDGGAPEDPGRVFAPLGRPLSTLLVRCLEEQPGRRPRDAVAIERALHAATRRRGLFLAAAVAVAAALGGAAVVLGTTDSVEGQPVVRVDPLDNRTGDAELGWLEHGVADLVAAGLEASGRVRLAPPGTAHAGAARVGGELVLERGAVSAKLLLRAPDGARLEEARIPRVVGDALFQGVDAAVRRFLGALEVRPPEGGSRAAVSFALTRNAEAFAHWARAQEIMRKHRPGHVEELRLATVADAGFALAHLQRYVYGIGQLTTPEVEAAFEMAALNRDRLTPSQRELLDAVAESRRAAPTRFDRLRAYLRAHPTDRLSYALVERLVRSADAGTHRAVLDEWLARFPDDPEVHNQLGYHFLRANDSEQAEREFREYLRLAPGEANAHDSMGDLLKQQGRLAEALREFDRAVALDPEFTTSALKSAEVALLADDLVDANSRLARARSVTSPTAMYFNRWIFMWVAVPVLGGDLQEALQRVESLAADPEVGSRATHARLFEAILWGLEGDAPRARRAAEEADRLSRLLQGERGGLRHLAAYVEALAAHRRGDGEALERAADALGAPESGHGQLLTGLRLLGSGEPSVGAERLARVRGSGIGFVALLERARALARAGRVQEADAAYDEAIDLRLDQAYYPETAHGWRACLGEAAERARLRGDEERARSIEGRLGALDAWRDARR